MAESYSVKAILSASDRGFSSAFKSAQSSAERLKSTLTSGLGFGIMTGIGQKAFSAITSGISGVTGELNESSAAWKTFNGNMQMIGKGTKSITKTRDELQDFATKTIYSASDMATTYSQLAAVGTKNCTKLVKGFGGLAAASENPTQAMKTLSQQATQAAAKPTIQWMDFKLMLEQTPAGIAAVAKGMGKTTSQLVQDVQDGKVKTEDFFNAIAKVGTSKSFTKLATSYKTAGQAMDGLKETLGVKLMPTFNKASDVAISGIEKVIGRLDKVDPDGLAKKVESAVSVVSPYWKAFSDATSKAGKAIINAVSAVGKSFGGLAQKKSSLDTFTSVVSGISDAIAHFAQIVADHSDEIASAAPKILKLLLAIKGFKIIQSLVPGVTTFAGALLKIGGKGIAALAGKLFGVVAGEKAVGTASKESFGSLVQSATAFLKMGAGIALIAAGFALLTFSAINLAKAGPLAAGVMLGMVVAIGGLLVVAKEVAPTLTAGAAGFIAFGAAVVLAGAGMLLLTTAATNLASAGPAAIGVMVGMVAAVALLAAGAAVLAPALTVGAVGFIAFGAAIVLAATGALIAGAALKIVVGVLPAVVQYGAAGAVSIAALGAAMLVFGTGASVAGAGCIVLGAGLVVVGAGATVAGAGLLVLGTAVLVASAGFTVIGNTITKVVDAISGGLTSVLNGIAKVINSVGTSAKNAGQGFKSVASGIKTISGLSIGSIAKSLGAVSIGLGKISKKGAGVGQAASGLKTLASASVSVNASFGTMGAVAASSLSAVSKSMSKVASTAKSAGRNAGSGYASALRSGLSKAASAASKAATSVNTRLRSGRSGAYSAGSYVSQGFASGMSSCLGQIEAAASRMVSAADTAIRAKAKIHSPSKLTKKHGGYMSLGFGNGILSKISEATKAAKKLVSETMKVFKTAKNKGNYESLGEKLSDKFKSQMEKRRDSALKSVKNMINAYVKPLKKHNKKASSKYTKAGRYLNSAFSKSYKAEVKKLIKTADSTFDKLGKKYQKKYDAIIDARKSFMENLGNISSLYTADDYGNIALKDFNVGTKQINAYAKNLEKLKKILPDGLMEEILGLSTAEGLAYTNNLLKMSTKDLKAYGASYTKFQNAAKKTATNYYAPKLSSLKKDFSAQVTKEAKALKKRMTTIGANAMSGFVSGMSSKKKSLSKESRILANEVIKAFRKKLKIHSPSRVFASLATYTAKGYINQLESMRHKIADVAQSIVTIPDVASPKLAGDYTGDLSTEYEYYSNAKYTIVVPVEVDGREVARTTAPYMQSELDSRQSRENRRRGRK
jgi:tape measure domain-containing protein